ncbi:MAG: PIN domain-containing protein [Nitrospirae bacterium]|nr:PIN domain-containing protein [Nitrospirota bacterium]
MRESGGVFVDTSAWYALTDEVDPRAGDAARTLARLAQERRPLHTSTVVVAETIALVAARLGKRIALRLGRSLRANVGLRIHADDEMLLGLAWEEFERTGTAVSLVDCHSFCTMRREGVRTAFAFDAHFRGAGFEVVP